MLIRCMRGEFYIIDYQLLTNYFKFYLQIRMLLQYLCVVQGNVASTLRNLAL